MALHNHSSTSMKEYGALERTYAPSMSKIVCHQAINLVEAQLIGYNTPRSPTHLTQVMPFPNHSVTNLFLGFPIPPYGSLTAAEPAPCIADTAPHADSPGLGRSFRRRCPTSTSNMSSLEG